MTNNKGFSLIELSIVLIIMGLLVAGITGGASLIKTAQLRSVITEATNYRRDYNTFYSQFSRVPGSTTEVPNVVVGADAWDQMKENGIIDREPGNETIPGIVSKYRGANWYLANDNEVATKGKITDFNHLNVLYIAGSYNFDTGVFSGIDARNIDDKLDDGNGNSGFVRGVAVDDDERHDWGDYGVEEEDGDFGELFSPISSAFAGGSNYSDEKSEGKFSLIMRMDF